jgi:hypothetical protein
MKRTFPTLLTLLLVAILSQGCVIVRYTHDKPLPPAWSVWSMTPEQEIEHTTFGVYAFFADEKATKIAIDKATKATSTGVTIGAVETQIDDDAIQAVVSGVVEGVVKGIK